MNMTKKKVGFAAATTAALLLAGCASDDKMSMNKKGEKGNDMGQCHGANACKGKSVCATADSACKGMNSCKGKGWVHSNEADCDSKGGIFKKP